MERTHAQKKHLINILAAKSQVDNRNPSSRMKHSSSGPLGVLQRRIVEKDNQSMVCRIMRITQEKPSLSRTDSELSLLRNLKTYSSLNRSIKLRHIQQENSKMFSRLITTSPTISRHHWSKSNLQTSKYKENLHRGKCTHPST
jgi:hypothetical protein